eukprot:1420150-Amphidinium_carterae.1
MSIIVPVADADTGKISQEKGSLLYISPPEMLHALVFHVAALISRQVKETVLKPWVKLFRTVLSTSLS